MLSCNEAGLAVGKVAPGLATKFRERSVRQPDNMRHSINKELCIDGVRMAGGNSVPHMREATPVGSAAQVGIYFKCADELAHRAGIGEYRPRHAVTFFIPEFPRQISDFYRLTAAAVSTWV